MSRYTPLVPCQHPDCPDPMGGKVLKQMVKPARLSGRRFGFGGVLCWTCYSRLNTRTDTAERRAATGKARRSAIDREGFAAPVQRRPNPLPSAPTTLASFRERELAQRAQAEPRRPCPASEKGGHRLSQERPGAFEPFTCQDCGWVFWPPLPDQANRKWRSRGVAS